VAAGETEDFSFSTKMILYFRKIGKHCDNFLVKCHLGSIISVSKKLKPWLICTIYNEKRFDGT